MLRAFYQQMVILELKRSETCSERNVQPLRHAPRSGMMLCLQNQLLGSVVGGAQVESANSAAETPKPQAEQPRVLDGIMSLALFIILFLLVANVSVLISAQVLNDAACNKAMAYARRGVLDGHRPEAVMRLAAVGVERTPTSFLVSSPEFVEFKDGYKNGKHSLRIKTRALAKIPAWFLMPNAPFDQHKQLSVSRTLEVEVGPEPAKAGSK